MRRVNEVKGGRLPARKQKGLAKRRDEFDETQTWLGILAGLCDRPLHALKHGCRQSHHPYIWTFLAFDVDRNAIGLRKWIGNQFKFFAIKANALAGRITEAFYIGTDFIDRGRFMRIAGHDSSILPQAVLTGYGHALRLQTEVLPEK
jgi:hypothetical protein